MIVKERLCQNFHCSPGLGASLYSSIGVLNAAFLRNGVSLVRTWDTPWEENKQQSYMYITGLKSPCSSFFLCVFQPQWANGTLYVQEKLKPWLMFNPRLELIDFQITRPFVIYQANRSIIRLLGSFAEFKKILTWTSSDLSSQKVAGCSVLKLCPFIRRQ